MKEKNDKRLNEAKKQIRLVRDEAETHEQAVYLEDLVDDIEEYQKLAKNEVF